MLPYPLNPKRLAVGSARNDQLVVLDLDNLSLVPERDLPSGGWDDSFGGSFLGGVGLDGDGLAGEVNVVCPALVEVDVAAGEAADGLEDGAELEGADRGGGEEGGEDEVGAGGDYDAVVFGGGEGAG